MLVVMVLVGACGDDTSVQIDAAAVDSNPTVTEGDHVQGLKQHAQGETDSGALPTILATTRLWGDLVSGIVCDGQAHVKILMPMGADPHTYQLSLADRAVLQDASLVVMNGVLEEGVATTIRSVEDLSLIHI